MPVVPRAASACPRSDPRSDPSVLIPEPFAQDDSRARNAVAELAMIGRLQQAGDFRRLLDAPVRQRSAHFAVHYLRATPSAAKRAGSEVENKDLSTGHEPNCPKAVDDQPASRWLGCMVPKRHARRAVTRSLIKRQMRAVASAHEGHLSAGLWLIRLSRPFSAQDFPSASSNALRKAARMELDRLMGLVAARQGAQA
ncbi:MAG: hypothetical protein RI949_1762 [Pseudomonadota bacterium]|jgi:ribonuclease P protein component